MARLPPGRRTVRRSGASRKKSIPSRSSWRARTDTAVRRPPLHVGPLNDVRLRSQPSRRRFHSPRLQSCPAVCLPRRSLRMAGSLTKTIHDVCPVGTEAVGPVCPQGSSRRRHGREHVRASPGREAGPSTVPRRARSVEKSRPWWFVVRRSVVGGRPRMARPASFLASNSSELFVDTLLLRRMTFAGSSMDPEFGRNERPVRQSCLSLSLFPKRRHHGGLPSHRETPCCAAAATAPASKPKRLNLGSILWNCDSADWCCKVVKYRLRHPMTMTWTRFHRSSLPSALRRSCIAAFLAPTFAWTGQQMPHFYHSRTAFATVLSRWGERTDTIDRLRTVSCPPRPGAARTATGHHHHPTSSPTAAFLEGRQVPLSVRLRQVSGPCTSQSGPCMASGRKRAGLSGDPRRDTRPFG
jgi:hypothetical protein